MKESSVVSHQSSGEAVSTQPSALSAEPVAEKKPLTGMDFFNRQETAYKKLVMLSKRALAHHVSCSIEICLGADPAKATERIITQVKQWEDVSRLERTLDGHDRVMKAMKNGTWRPPKKRRKHARKGPAKS